MKRALYLIILAAAMLTPALAQSTKPVSSYVRNVGVLYLEAVEDLTLDCGQKSTVDSDCKRLWDSKMDGLQDRIEITLSESKRPSGDKPLYELLKETRYARDMYASGSFKEKREAWSHAYIVCAAHAHTAAVEGELFKGDGGCSDAISEATK